MLSFDTNIHILTYTNIHTICPMHKTVAEGRMLIKDLFCSGGGGGDNIKYPWYRVCLEI